MPSTSGTSVQPAGPSSIRFSVGSAGSEVWHAPPVPVPLLQGLMK